MTGSLLAMPLLIMNMGGEMIYILEQRLRAQEIAKDKAERVLNDVVRTMYNAKFITELFKPQEMYSVHSTRQIFDRLAHSSIMRLNTTSMDKLFDLMTMGFKQQMLCCASPTQLIDVTINHLDEIMHIATDAEVLALVQRALDMTHQVFGGLAMGDWFMLKQTLCRFFHNRRVKVSLFLADKLQKNNGSIVLQCDGEVPAGVEVPGMVRYFSPAGELTATSHVEVAGRDRCIPHRSTALRTRLGENLYRKPRASSSSAAAAAAPASGSGVATSAAASDTGHPKGEADDPAALDASAKAELNLLAELLGAAAGGGDEMKGFRINLYADDPIFGTSDDSSTGMEKTAEVITIDAKGDSRRHATEMMAKLGWEEEPAAGEGKGGEDDDLLALMDSAGR